MKTSKIRFSKGSSRPHKLGIRAMSVLGFGLVALFSFYPGTTANANSTPDVVASAAITTPSDQEVKSYLESKGYMVLGFSYDSAGRRVVTYKKQSGETVTQPTESIAPMQDVSW